MPRLAELERQFGSVTRGLARATPTARPSAAPPPPLFYTLEGGLSQLADALAARLPPGRKHTRTTVRRIRATAGGFAVDADGPRTVFAPTLVLALPAPQAAGLIAPLEPDAAQLLAGIPFASTATLLLGYRRERVDHALDGHGLLIPRSEGLRTTACTFVSQKFPGRAPEGHVLLRAFLGGARDPGIGRMEPSDILHTALRELTPLLGLHGDPCLRRVWPWPEAMPQMQVGHGERVSALEKRLRAVPGLFVTGAGLRGTGIPDCVADGYRTADAALQYLTGTCAA